jgi:phosphohistidine phosphatase
MQLYLIRHAIAAGASAASVVMDSERALTEVGAKKMRKQALALKRMGVEFDVVLTSPLVRAHQTAEIVCEVLGCPDRITRCDALAPGCEAGALVRVLRDYELGTRIAAVGHNPDFEKLASALIGRGLEGGIQFKKGAICRIDVHQLTPQLSGELVWHLTPKLLRMVAK